MTHRMLKDLVVATHNSGKLTEIQKLLEPFGVSCTSAGALGLAEPEETESTFEGNARIKAHYAAKESGLPALSDDSGIIVDGLDGAPGVYTADWAETPTGRDFFLAMSKVHEQLLDCSAPSPWTARFHCTLCLAWPDGQDQIFNGAAEGQVIWPIRGTNGFGFDPMFLPKGQDRTFGEMSADEKQPLTHRAAAFAQLVETCFEN